MDKLSGWTGDEMERIKERDQFETAMSVVLMAAFLGVFIAMSAVALGHPKASAGTLAALCVAVIAIAGWASRRPDPAATLSVLEKTQLDGLARQHPEIALEIDRIKTDGGHIRKRELHHATRMASEIEAGKLLARASGQTA